MNVYDYYNIGLKGRAGKTLIFLGFILGWILASSQSKNEQKLPKIVNNILNSFALHFGKKNHENLTWNSKDTDVCKRLFSHC